MKLFNLEEANALLPAVKRIVKEIQQAHTRLGSFRQQALRASEGAELGGGGFAPGSGRYVAVLLTMVERVGELEELGVQLKDYTRGLIDFPCMRDGRVVLLCWQLGEGDHIEWWHDMETGFAGRQPL